MTTETTPTPTKRVRKAPTAAKTTATPARARKQRSMSDDHKNALAQGRNEGRAVTNYLNALETNRPKRGRKRTPESIARRIDAIDAKLVDADPLSRLHLIQERMNLQNEASRLQDRTDLSDLEAAFIQVAKAYGERKGITTAAWLSLNVPRSVLRQAGI